jgi:hypothetical protein
MAIAKVAHLCTLRDSSERVEVFVDAVLFDLGISARSERSKILQLLQCLQQNPAWRVLEIGGLRADAPDVAAVRLADACMVPWWSRRCFPRGARIAAGKLVSGTSVRSPIRTRQSQGRWHAVARLGGDAHLGSNWSTTA